MKLLVTIFVLAAIVLFPAAPTDLTAELVRGGGNTKFVQLTWQDNSFDELGFEVWQSENGGPFRLLARLPTDYEFLSTLAGTPKYRQTTHVEYMVRAFNNCSPPLWTGCDYSDWSNVASPW